LAAAGHRDALAARAESATVRERAAERSALDAREHRQDLRERRLDGMAAELAAEQLSEGCACPVCGSERHPAPALPSADRVTREQEQRAAAEQEAAEARLRQVAAELRELDAELAAIRAAAGPAPVAELAAGLDGLRTRHHRAARAAAGGTAAEERLAGLAAEHAVRSAERDSAADRLIGYTARLDQLAVEAERLTRDLDLARGDDPSVAARRDRLAPAAAAASAVVRAAAEAEGAAGRADAARSQAVRAAVGAGFADPAEAEAARLGPAEAEQVDRRLAAWREEEAGVRRGLAEPELLEAAALAPADPPAAEARLDGATDLLRAASATEYACREQCRQLDALGRELAGRLVRLAPVEAEFRLADRLSALAGGTGSDNALKMQLQSYVLAARLEQVAAAAGVRLEVMSGGRYTLVHSDEPASNGRRSGLGLRVLDAWTGRSRDTATLSGGESFFCSLALALGLADVVTDEAGGRPLDTLFVDEGFGTLDEETLDEVMDVLDNLRERDRAVGIVSHVADLRRRIPMQLRVRKGRTGSTVQLTGPSAG
jgi:exonuclease SbcC